MKWSKASSLWRLAGGGPTYLAAHDDMDSSEIYSPPQIAVKAAEMGLNAGWGLDRTTKDHDGRRRDFSKPDMGKWAMDKIKQGRPIVAIRSPTCTDWSTMMNMH